MMTFNGYVTDEKTEKSQIAYFEQLRDDLAFSQNDTWKLALYSPIIGFASIAYAGRHLNVNRCSLLTYGYKLVKTSLDDNS